MGLGLLPLIFLGFFASRYTRAYLDGVRLRPVLLSIAALSSLAVVIRALAS